MKGVVFAEFLELVDSEFGFETTEAIIADCELPSGAAYTGVGTYDYHEILQLVTALSKRTEVPVPDLVRVFGKYLFSRLAKSHAAQIAGAESAFDLLNSIEDHIHVEVLKLYPDAELPRIDTESPDSDTLSLTYRSSRPFADLALGLIEGCLDHFGSDCSIETEDLSQGQGTAMRFKLSRRAA